MCQTTGPKIDQTERQRNKKLSQDGEARNLSREEHKMTVIMTDRGDETRGDGAK